MSHTVIDEQSATEVMQAILEKLNMTIKINSLILVITYLGAVFFCYAILRHLYTFLSRVNPAADDILVSVRVFLSAPMLILCGALLIVKFRQHIIHRIFGIAFLLSGIAWAIKVIMTIVNEAA